MMISSLLALIFIAMAAIGVLLVVSNVKKYSKGKKIAGVSLFVAGAVMFAIIPLSIHTVEAGEVAVVKHMGAAEATRQAGTHWDFWLVNTYETYDVKVQNLDIDTSTYSKDGQTMDIQMTVQYQINPEKAIEIANNYGSLNTLSNKIQSVSTERAKATLAEYSAMTIIETRASISPEVERAVKAAIDENYYVTVNTVVLTNIDFTDAFEATVENKMIAEQEKLKAEYDKQTAIINAEKELEVAKKEAEAKLYAAEKDAEAKLAIAEAEAKSITYKSIEIAKMLGYNVTTTTSEDGDVVYTIEFTPEHNGSDIAEYLKYIEYLSKWDGKLPDVLTDGSGVMITIPA